MEKTRLSRLAHPLEKVWAAISIPERIGDWFCEMNFEARPGARIDQTFHVWWLLPVLLASCVIATPAHRAAFLKKFDSAEALRLGQLKVLDAEEMLAKFMAGATRVETAVAVA